MVACLPSGRATQTYRKRALLGGGDGLLPQTTVWSAVNPGPGGTGAKIINSGRTITMVGATTTDWYVAVAAIDGHDGDTGIVGLKYWEFEIIDADADWIMLGAGWNGSDNTYIGNYGAYPAMAIATPGNLQGTDAGGSESLTLVKGGLYSCYYDEPHRKFWISPDNVNFYGDPAVGSDNPVTNVGGIDFTNIWVPDSIRPVAGISGLKGTVTLRTGPNCLRTPLGAYTKLP